MPGFSGKQLACSLKGHSCASAIHHVTSLTNVISTNEPAPIISDKLGESKAYRARCPQCVRSGKTVEIMVLLRNPNKIGELWIRRRQQIVGTGGSDRANLHVGQGLALVRKT